MVDLHPLLSFSGGSLFFMDEMQFDSDRDSFFGSRRTKFRIRLNLQVAVVWR